MQEKKESPDKVFRWKEDLLWYQDQIYVPRNARKAVLQEVHRTQLAGHFSREKTLARLKIRYFFPTIRKAVDEFIGECDLCKRTKHE